jgi:putative peptide zinc metalloprotease protein
MKRLLITCAALVAALALAGLKPTIAAAATTGGDTAAIAVNTKDDSSIFKLAFAIKRIAGDVVDNSNAAVSFASCTNCRTVAISIQIVLVTDNPSTVTPENLALAINQNCTSCETLATAYQFVLSTHGQVRFTQAGRKEIHAILQELRALKDSTEPVADVQAKVDALMQRLAVVLRNELVHVGPGEEDEPDDTTDSQQDEEDTLPTDTVTTAPTETTPTVTTDTGTTETGTTTTTP